MPPIIKYGLFDFSFYEAISLTSEIDVPIRIATIVPGIMPIIEKQNGISLIEVIPTIKFKMLNGITGQKWRRVIKKKPSVSIALSMAPINGYLAANLLAEVLKIYLPNRKEPTLAKSAAIITKGTPINRAS